MLPRLWPAVVFGTVLFACEALPLGSGVRRSPTAAAPAAAAPAATAPAAPTAAATAPAAPSARPTTAAATTAAPSAPPAAAAAPAAPRRPRADDPPPLAREFRAAWVATVDNIDWPSRKDLPTAAARAELDALVDRAAAVGLNALVFQVRPAADALYASKLEPWSEWLTGAQGKAPQPAWDPLAHVIERCHARGLELHAWFNPYRAGHPAGKSPAAANQVRKKLPSAVVTYGEYEWMDPGNDRAAEWTHAVIRDVVRRYDVDGVHIDDYFYPYPVKGKDFPDADSYARYRQKGGKLDRGDWRRRNIDQFVERFYRDVHQEKAWVQVGISPFGIARPGVPEGTTAGVDQFGGLYADVVKWQQQGWLDYLTPQLYWPIDQTKQSFAKLLPWWHAQNTAGRHLWPGLSVVRLLDPKPPTRSSELADQLELVRGAAGPGGSGHVLYSFKALRRDLPGVAGTLQRFYTEPAVAPASPWLGGAAPAAPTGAITGSGAERQVTWRAAGEARFLAVQVRQGQRWRTHAVRGAAVGACDLPAGAEEVALTALGRNGLASPVVRLTP